MAFFPFLVYVDGGFGGDPGYGSVFVDELVSPAEEAEGRSVVRGPLEFRRKVEIDFLGRRGGGEKRRLQVGLCGEPPVVIGRELGIKED